MGVSRSSYRRSGPNCNQELAAKMIDVTSSSGKYQVVQHEDGTLLIFRHGEAWIYNPQGAKMIIELCCEIEELRKQKSLEK